MAIEKLEWGLKPKSNGGLLPDSYSCSLDLLHGLTGTYDSVTMKYGPFQTTKPGRPTIALATDHQEKGTGFYAGNAVKKGLEEAGFVKLGSYESTHRGYKCNLWYGPVDGVYKFIPNPELFTKGGGKDLTEELEQVHEQYDELERENLKLKNEIAELKGQLREKRLLRKKVTAFGRTNTKVRGVRSARTSKTKRSTSGRM